MERAQALCERLVSGGFVTEEQAQRCLDIQQQKGVSVDDILVGEGLITELDTAQLLTTKYLTQREHWELLNRLPDVELKSYFDFLAVLGDFRSILNPYLRDLEFNYMGIGSVEQATQTILATLSFTVERRYLSLILRSLKPKIASTA